jgi:hypothetical protein
MSAHYWYLFWTANLVIAGSAFFIITVVVMIRGIGDLKGMFARLRVSGTHGDFLHKERQNPHS